VRYSPVPVPVPVPVPAASVRWLTSIARENGDHVKVLVRDRRGPSSRFGIDRFRGRQCLRPRGGRRDGRRMRRRFSALRQGGLGPRTDYSPGSSNK
jgi:hypothetical protein